MTEISTALHKSVTETRRSKKEEEKRQNLIFHFIPPEV
jgi:hypothetical protein